MQVPDKMRMKIDTGAGDMKFTFIRVVNGDKVWIEVGRRHPEVDDKDQIKEAKEELYADRVKSLLPLVKEKGFKLEALGEVKVDGKPAVGVRVSHKGHRDVNLFFNKDTGLLVKSEQTVKDFMAGGNEADAGDALQRLQGVRRASSTPRRWSSTATARSTSMPRSATWRRRTRSTARSSTSRESAVMRGEGPAPRFPRGAGPFPSRQRFPTPGISHFFLVRGSSRRLWYGESTRTPSDSRDAFHGQVRAFLASRWQRERPPPRGLRTGRADGIAVHITSEREGYVPQPLHTRRGLPDAAPGSGDHFPRSRLREGFSRLGHVVGAGVRHGHERRSWPGANWSEGPPCWSACFTRVTAVCFAFVMVCALYMVGSTPRLPGQSRPGHQGVRLHEGGGRVSLRPAVAVLRGHPPGGRRLLGRSLPAAASVPASPRRQPRPSPRPT